MENIVQKIPFLRPTLSLAFGVYIGSIFDFSITALILLSVTLLSISFFLNRTYKYYWVRRFGFLVQILFILIGILVSETHNKKPVFLEKGVFIATVLEKPQEKENSYKSVIKILSVKKNDTIIQTKEKVLVYFEKNDSALNLNPGNNIVFKSSPQLIKNYGNPFEFNYKKYLSNKKIFRQIYLSSENWKKTNLSSNFSITIYAEQIREKLLTIYRNQKLGKNELEILSALTLGYKRELAPKTKRIFSAAGAMHVLAVSGLHVGIIFWVVTLLFAFLQKRKYGRPLFVVVTILSLWGYAFITGLSPSVMRASTMFTIFVIGDNLNRKANSYNSLAASALFLLLFNPNNLFEIGFQLSYSAVFGIVFLQPKLSKLLPVKNKFIKFFWTLLTISIAAQIATFPLTTFYFNQFPTYFLITNLIIVPAVMILIPLGIALLLFSEISLISGIISGILNFIIKWCYIILYKIEQLPHSIQKISIHPFELLLLIGILLSIFLLIQKFNTLHLKATLIFTLFFLISFLCINLNQIRSQEIIVYNSPQNPTFQLISGKTNYVISEHKIKNDENTNNIIRLTNRKLRLKPPIYITKSDSLKNSFLFFKNGLLLFEGKNILFQNNIPDLPKTIPIDFIINSKQFNELDNPNFKNTTLITNKRSLQEKNSVFKRVHLTSKQGAFIEKW